MQIVEKHLRHYNVKTNSMVKAKLRQIVVHCTRTLDMTKKIPSQLDHVRKQLILNGALLKCFSIFKVRTTNKIVLHKNTKNRLLMDEALLSISQKIEVS